MADLRRTLKTAKGYSTPFQRKQVLDIRKRLAEGEDAGEIAKRYGRDREAIMRIKRGKTYYWIK